MSTGYRCICHVLCSTLQLLVVLGCSGTRRVMAIEHYNPYVSEFEYASRFHPSKNPNCPAGEFDNLGEREEGKNPQDFQSSRYERSQEERPPVREEPSIEVRAILVRCPKSEKTNGDVLMNRNIYNITAKRSQDFLDFHGFDSDETARHSEIWDCRRKLIITMKFNNVGRTKIREEFVVIDHVLDPITMKKARLLNPLVVKVRQEPVLQLYGLKFQGVVNAEAREEVLNKKLSNYTGCDDVTENPTCGQMIFEGNPIPHSQGFCCSCDPEVNVQRQASLLNESDVSSFSSFLVEDNVESSRPFKSPKSVKENFHDDLTDLFESDDVASQSEGERSDVVRSNIKNLRSVGSNFYTIQENNSGIRNRHSENDEEDLQNLKESYLGAVNLTGELMKLEKDYKNFQFSSEMRAVGRSTPAQDMTMVKLGSANPGIDRINEVNVENFTVIESPETRSSNKTGDVSILESASAQTLKGKLALLSEDKYSPGSTISIDVDLEIRPKQKSTSHQIDSVSSSSSYTESSPLIPMNTESVSKTETPAVLWQKLVSDKVHPSSTRFNISESNKKRNLDPSFPLEVTTNIGQKFDSDVETHLANTVMSDDTQGSSKDVESNASVQLVSERENSTTTSENSTPLPVVVTETTEGTLMASFNNRRSHVVSSTNSPSSLSSGNFTDQDAILLSGSLKNQLANWFRYDKREKSKRKNSHGQVPCNDKVATPEIAIASEPKVASNVMKGPILYEDQSLPTMNDRRPDGIQLRTRYHGYASRNAGSDGKLILKTEKDGRASLKAFQDPADLDEKDSVSRDKSNDWNVQRLYRSIADEDSYFGKDNDRQESIDKHIQDEYKEISNALKEAADGPKIIKVKPKNPFNFKQDNSVIRKFAAIFDNSLKETTHANAKNELDRTEIQLKEFKFTKAVEPVSEIAKTTEHQIVVDRFKIANNFRHEPVDYETTVHETNLTTVKNVPSRVRDLQNTTSNNTAVESTPVIKYEPFKDPNLEVHHTVDPKIIVDRFKLFNNNHEILFHKPPQARILTNLATVSPNLREITGTSSSTNLPLKLIGIDNIRNGGPVNNKTSLTNDLSPVAMIDNLKKELKKEAQRCSSISRSTDGRSGDEEVQEHSNLVNKVREINTELTPAEKDQDLVTDEGTLPPDEETKYTTVSIHETTISRYLLSDHGHQMNATILPRLEIQAPLIIPSKRTKKVLIHLDEPSASFSTPSNMHARRERRYNERVHRSYHSRNNRNRKRSIKPSLSIKRLIAKKMAIDNNTNHFGSNGRTKLVTRPPVEAPVKKRKRKLRDSSQQSSQLYASIPRIFESGQRPSSSRLRINEIPGINHTPQLNSYIVQNSNKPKMTSDAQKSLSQINKMPVFRSTGLTVVGNRTGESRVEPKRNLHLQSVPKFRSYYPTSNDIIAMSRTEDSGEAGQNNKRNFEDSEPESLVFYDYDESKAEMARKDSNHENRRSRSGENIVSRNADSQSIVKRKSLTSHDHSRSDTQESVNDVELSREGNAGKDIKEDKQEQGTGIQFGIEPLDGWKEKMELLKLKKHADVLKEYLNWRQDIEEPAPHRISDYMTKISLENATEETTDFITTDIFNVSNEMILANTLSMYPIYESSRTVQEDKDVTTFKGVAYENNVTNEPITSNSLTLSPALPSNIHLENCYLDKLKTTDTKKISTELPDSKYLNTYSSLRYNDESSTGRILPHCGSAIVSEKPLRVEITTDLLKFPENVDHSTNQSEVHELVATSNNVIANHSKHLEDVSKDLIIISVLEKSIENQKAGRTHRNESLYRQSHSTSKPKIKRNGRVGRRVMATQDFGNRDHNDDNDSTFDDIKDNIYMEQSNNEYSYVSTDEQDSEHLNRKWGSIIDKVIHSNSSRSSNTTNPSDPVLIDPLHNDKRVMKQLHFYNADKFIKQIAKKIVHNDNIHDPQHIERSFPDTPKVTRHKQSFHKYNPTKRHVIFRRELMNYPRYAKRLSMKKAALKNRNKFIDGEDKSRPKMDCSDYHTRDISFSQVHPKSRNADVINSSVHTVVSDLDKGRDIAISVSGKIHVQGGMNGQPMSISFDTFPGIAKTNEAVQNPSNTSAKIATKSDSDSGPSKNFLSSLFNIPTDLKDLAHHSQDSQNSNGSSIKSVQESLQNHYRRSRAIDTNTDRDFPKYRDLRSDDLKMSIEQVSNDEYKSDDYLKSSLGDENDPTFQRQDNQQVKVIKIIPLNPSVASASLSSMDRSHDNSQNQKKSDTKASRMTASQLPNSDDEYIPGTTVKPGRIKTAELPWQDNDNDDPENSLGPCPLISQPPEVNPENSDACNETTDRISTSNPVNVKIIGLVSMEQPLLNDSEPSNVNSDSNFKIVPLVHVKIKQQPLNNGNPNHDCNYQVRPDYPPLDISPQPVGGCSEMEMTNSMCSDINAEGQEIEGEDEREENENVVTMNDGESREQISIEPCHQSNSDWFPRIRPTEETSPCAGDQGPTDIDTTHSQNVMNKTNRRKMIRLKNMLAIMKFMNRIKTLMFGATPDFMGKNNNDALTKLEKIMVIPANHPAMNSGRSEDSKQTVIIGEGVNHEPPENEVLFPESKSCNVTLNTKDIPNKTNGTLVENDQNQSFLFYKYNLNDSNTKQSAKVFYHPNEINKNHDAAQIRTGKDNTVRLFEVPKKTGRIFTSIKDVDGNNSASNSVISESTNSTLGNLSIQHDDNRNMEKRNGLTESAVLRNLEQKINDRLRNADISLTSKVKRHRLPTDSRMDRIRYRGERNAGSQIYRSRSLPNSRSQSRPGKRHIQRYAGARGFLKQKAGKNKKKKKWRRKKNKKNKKKNKGKVYREAAVEEKSSWPFGRQLMSVSGKRQLILDSNLGNRQLQQLIVKKQTRRSHQSSLEQRKRRRAHHEKYPHVKKKKPKKRRKHKKKSKRIKKKKNKKGEPIKFRLRNKRQIKPDGSQVRGGQDCMGRRHPPNVNPTKYLESAHCLRFSDLWYSVYELENPIIEHTVYLQLFEKHSLEDGSTHWDDLTQGTMVRMGTFTRQRTDTKPNIQFIYTEAKMETQKSARNLDASKQRLLVPSPVAPAKAAKYPEVKRGSNEYLVVQSNAISKDGNECDKAGVGFAAFTKQQDRCSRPKGSCLKNQPLAYWRHDMEARESGKPGCYFLSNFASVPTNPIKYNVSGTGSRQYLGLEYHLSHVSAVDIELRTDYNAIVRVGSSGRVTEVYVDSTAVEHTVVTVVISNMGLASSPYQPRITDCPTGLPVSWTKAKGIMQVIPPQHDQRVTLDLYGQLLLNGFHCSVEVVNHRGEIVAMRRIRVQRMDRCFCVWHCLCACIGSLGGMRCQPMSPKHYYAAGFQGSVPVVTKDTSIVMNTVEEVFMLSVFLIVFLLLLGILKWLVGIFIPIVGRWGLDSLLERSQIDEYLESDLRCRCLMTDEDGALDHPDTGRRTVRICSRKLEFILNLLFFLTYPIAVCRIRVKRAHPTPARQGRRCHEGSKMRLINEKSSCPKMICVSTYGDSRNSKLEAEDTRYVMNELKKSQESLQKPKRTKKNYPGKNDSRIFTSQSNKSDVNVRARTLVDELLKKRMVFRNLMEPISGLEVPSRTAYSLRGYFLNTENGGYRFITPCPFKQYWLIVNNQKKALTPTKNYPSSHFSKSFHTALDVYTSDELSLNPKGVCINVQNLQDGSRDG